MSQANMFHHTGIKSINELKNVLPKRKHHLLNKPCAGTNDFYVFDAQNHLSNINKYVLRLYAADSLGRKCIINVNNIDVYFDVRLSEHLMDDIGDKQQLIIKRVTLKKKPFKGYQDEYIDVERVYCRNLEDRDTLMNLLKHHELGNNIQSSKYMQSVSRRHPLTLLGWNTLRNISEVPAQSMKCDRFIVCDINDIFATTESIRDIPLIVMTLDIETFTNNIYAGAPKPDDDDAEVYIIGCTFHYATQTDTLYRVALSSLNTVGEDILKCENERDILIAFAILLENMDPDIITEFSGFAYDWPFILDKACNYFVNYGQDVITVRDMIRKCFCNDNDFTRHIRSSYEPRLFKQSKNNESGVFESDKYLGKRSYRNNLINKYVELKVSPSNMYKAMYPSYPGKVCIDMRFIATRREGKESFQTQSLNHFLTKNGIKEKMDINYRELDQVFITHRLPEELFNTGKSGTIYKMNDHRDKWPEYYNKAALAIEYCIYDAYSTFLLFNKLDIIRDMQEEALLCKISFRQCVYNAGSFKVLNNILCEPDSEQYMLNERPDKNVDRIKYDGGLLFMPKCELNRDPVGDLDVNSEYPNVDIVYNMSPEKCIRNVTMANTMRARGMKLHEVNFRYGGKDTDIKDRIHGRSWFIQYDRVTEEGMGIFPKALLKLRQTRLSLQAELARYNKLIAIIQAGGTTDEIENICEEDKIAYLKWKAKSLNIAQEKRKILMNTFYGVTGSPTSPLFMLDIAAGITSTSVIITSLMATTAQANGFEIVYGDTDSTYLKLNRKYYEEIERDYIDNPRVMHEKKIELYINRIKELAKIVNDTFENFTGSKYLAVKYEKTLCPSIFCGMKAYLGVKHIDKPDIGICFDNTEMIPSRLCIKGSLTSPNMSEFSRNIIKSVLARAMSFTETLDIVDIIYSEIDKRIGENTEICNISDLKPYIRIGKNKPEANPTHHIRKFIANLEALSNDRPEYMILVPKPGDRFEYVISDKLIDPYGEDQSKSLSYVTVNNFLDSNYLRAIELCERLGIDKKSYFKEAIGGLAKLIYRHERYNMDNMFTDDVINDRTLFKKACAKAINMVKRKIMNNRVDIFPSPKSIESKQRSKVKFDKNMEGVALTKYVKEICDQGLFKTRAGLVKYVEENIVAKRSKWYTMRLRRRLENMNMLNKIAEQQFNMKYEELKRFTALIWKACSRARMGLTSNLSQDTVDKVNELIEDCAYYHALTDSYKSYYGASKNTFDILMNNPNY